MNRNVLVTAVIGGGLCWLFMSLTGCGTSLEAQCAKSRAAIEVYETCQADPKCRMNENDRRWLIQAKTDWYKYNCEGLSNEVN